jgi:mannose-6-phosphate isomerase-like protein (cupin superfamily)
MALVKNMRRGIPYRWPTHTNALLIDRKGTRGTEVFLTTIMPGKSTHPHVHDANEQLYIVVSGRGRIVFRPGGGSRRTRTVGCTKDDIVFIPMHEVHQVFCRGTTPLRYVTVDIFPSGKPADEPTWAAHAARLRTETRAAVTRRRRDRVG